MLPREQALERLSQVDQDVPAVGNLDRAGSSTTGAVSVRAGAITAENLHPWMFLEPGRERCGRALGLEVRSLRVSTAEELAEVLSREAGERTEAVLTLHSGFMSSHRQQIFDFAARSRLPVMYGNRLYTEAGGLAAYGPDLLAIHYRAAAYVDKILKGANPAELSVELPTKLDFIINLKAAQAIGITIPQSVLQQATEVIE